MARKTKEPQVDAPEDDDPEGTPQTEAQKKLHARALERWKILDEYWRKNMAAALEAIKFRSGEEWPEEIKRKREEKGRPVLTLRRGEQYIRQIVNDGRQNRPSVKYRPVDSGADVKTAEALQGLVRSILANSNADEAFDNALENGCGSGFGFFRAVTDYAHDGSFEQDIFVRRIPNPLSVRLGPHQSADGSDCEEAFVVDDMSRSEFKRKYPNAKFTDWKADSAVYAEDWLSELSVRVAEYFHLEREPATLYLLGDGQAMPKDDYDRLLAGGAQDLPPIVKQRQVMDVKCKWCRMSGAEILEENEFPSRYIPIFPVYGTERNVNGRVSYEGAIALAKDSLQLYNYERTAYCERVALTPKAPYIAAEGQLEGHPEWETANEENHPYLTYNQVDVNGERAPPPRREQVADIPSHYAQSIQITERDIQASFGMYNASLGAPSNEKSGRAITARQREGDVSSFHYHDNLNRAVRHLGRVLMDMIPRVIDTRRQARMLGEDGTDEQIIVDPNAPRSGDRVNGFRVFNFGLGRYDVDVSAGPSYTTKRQESADSMIEMARANPAVWQTHGDLIVKSQDWPGADEFAERSKALMPPEVKAAIAAEKKGDDEGPPPEVKAIMEQAQQVIGQKDEQIQEMGQALEQAQQAVEDAQRAVKEAKEVADLKAREVRVKAYEAETSRLKEIIPALTMEQAAYIVDLTVKQVGTPYDLDLSPGDLVARQPQAGEGMGALGDGVMPEMPSEMPPAGLDEMPRAPPRRVQGINPDVMAVLDAFQRRTEELATSINRPRRRTIERDPATGAMIGVIDEPEAPMMGAE